MEMFLRAADVTSAEASPDVRKSTSFLCSGVSQVIGNANHNSIVVTDPMSPNAKASIHVIDSGGCTSRVTVDTSGVPLHGEDQIYVFNSFLMSISSKFLAEGVSIYYCVVNLVAQWEELGLKS